MHWTPTHPKIARRTHKINTFQNIIFGCVGAPTCLFGVRQRLYGMRHTWQALIGHCPVFSGTNTPPTVHLERLGEIKRERERESYYPLSIWDLSPETLAGIPFRQPKNFSSDRNSFPIAGIFHRKVTPTNTTAGPDYKKSKV